MITIVYGGKEYKCEITRRDVNAIRVRVYDEKNVGNLYIWTKEYKEKGEGPRPWPGNTSKLIPKGAVYEAFNRLLRPQPKPEVVRQSQDAALTVLPEEKQEIKPRTRKAVAKTDRFS